uniref:DM domain-containing protein n=1 Tax=Plectus sambesii TaxID=2011161 RepID=A0A914WCN5_9BILA
MSEAALNRKIPPFPFTSILVRRERIPNCQKCGQHGRKARLKGHKRSCPYRACNCPKCQVIGERQKLMADQIKIRRRQRKEVVQVVPPTSSNANQGGDLHLPVLLPFPTACDINALLYKQLQQRTAMLLSPSSPSDGGSLYGRSGSFSSSTASASPRSLSVAHSPDELITGAHQRHSSFLSLPLHQQPAGVHNVDEQFRLFLGQVRMLEQSMLFERDSSSDRNLNYEQNVFVDVCTV